MQPIASHEEKNLERSGTFVLYPDHIDATIRQPLRGNVSASVPLAELSPSVAWLEVRSSIFNAGLWAIVAAVVGLSVSVFIVLGPKAQGLLCAAFAVGVLCCVAAWKRGLFALLIGVAGGNRVAIGVGPTGRDGLRLFAAQIEEAVKADHAAHA